MWGQSMNGVKCQCVGTEYEWGEVLVCGDRV